MLITIRLASFAVLLSWCSATSSHLPVQGDDLQRTVPEIRYRREAPSRTHESPSATASSGAHEDASSQAPGTHELSIIAASNRHGRLTHHGMDLSATAHDRADQQPDPEYMEDPTHPGRFWFRFGLMDAVEGAPRGRPPLEGQGVAQRVEVAPPLRRNDQITEEEERKQTGERVSQAPDQKRPNPIPVHKKETFPAKKATFPKKQDASRVTITNSSPEKENKLPPFVNHPNPNLGLNPNPVSSQKPNTHHPQQRIPPPSLQQIPPPSHQQIPPPPHQRIPPPTQQRIPPPPQQRIPPSSQQRIPPPTQQRIPPRPPQRIPAPPRPQRPLSRPSGGIHAIPAPNNGRPAVPSVITGSRRPSQPIRPPGGVGNHLLQGFRPTTVPSRRRPVTPQGRPAPPRIITAAERLDNSAKPQSFDLFASASLNFGGRPPVAPGTPSDVVVGYFKKDEPNGVRGARLFNELNKGQPAFQPPGPGSQVRQVIQVGAQPKPNLSRPQPFAQSQANFHAHPAAQTNQVGKQRIVVPSPVRQSQTVQRVTAGQITSGGQAQRTRPPSHSGHPRKPRPPAPVQISAPELDVRKPVATQSDLGHSGQAVSNGDGFTVQHSEQIKTLLEHESSRQVQQDAPPNSSTSALAGQADSDSNQGKIENIGHTGGPSDGPGESAKLRPTPIHSSTQSSTSVGSGNISIPPGQPEQRVTNNPKENQNRKPANPTPVQNHPNSPSFPGKEVHRLRPPPPLPPQKHSPQGNGGKHIGRPSANGAAPGHSPKHPQHPRPGSKRNHPVPKPRPVIPGGNAPPLRVPSQPRRPIVRPPGSPAHPRPSSRRDGPRLPPRPPPKTGLRPPGAPRPLPPSGAPAPPKTGLRPPTGAPRPLPPGRVPAPSTAGGRRPSGPPRLPSSGRPTPGVGPAARVPLQPPQGSREAPGPPITDRHDGSSAFHQQYYHGSGGGKHPQALSYNQGYKYVPAGYEAYHGYPYNVEGHNYGKDFTLSVPGYGRDQIHAQRPAVQGHGQNQGHSHGLGQGHGGQGYRHSHMHGHGPGHGHEHGHGGQSYPRIPHTHVPLSSPQHTGHSQVHQGHSHHTNSEPAVSHSSSEPASLSEDTDYSTGQASQTKDTVANQTKLTNATESDNNSDKETKTNEDGEPGAEYSSTESSSNSSSDSDDSSSDEKAGPKEPLVTSGSYTAPAPEPVHEGDLVHEYSDYDDHGDYHDHDDYHDDGGYDGYVDSSGNDFGRYH
ncbi:basic proline-rich protein-like [Amphibalanus amphitrite]|uniref:basic proline-rich protein-like n=1 Tax=Amphibalanus amphitrite TaxID=1232801 RepID=UPI001C922971|nr:basic proline-rich protein-like [Amphibalanus amphitrite]